MNSTSRFAFRAWPWPTLLLTAGCSAQAEAIPTEAVSEDVSSEEVTPVEVSRPDTSLRIASASWCRSPPPRTCDFYLSCLEVDLPCGVDGYAQSYGDKYCRRFLDEARLSEEGCVWRDATLSCLQYRLVRFLGSSSVTCERVTDAAFDDHPECYTQIGSSICSLPVGDWWIIARVVDMSDLLSLRSAKQIEVTLATCIGDAFLVAPSADVLERRAVVEYLHERIAASEPKATP